MNRFKPFAPLLIFALILVFLWRSLALHPHVIPSPLLEKPAPSFTLLNILNTRATTQADFLGKITLVNVWATWCYSCAEEHAFLMQLAHNRDYVLYGLNYKDNILDVNRWLTEKGNPYSIIAFDPFGKAAMDWGVYGTPETFIIDKRGMIRYKIIGPIDQNNWQSDIKPMIEHLMSES